ncbi:MAG TPA: NifU family protein [Chryseolinea sp.]|nr:NifU family protein [Chryseolinea sp.]
MLRYIKIPIMLQAAPKNVHIYLESNPNPNSLKFVVNDMLVPEGMSFDFPDAASASVSPLAQELFSHAFVDRVFFASNFVTVTKKGDVEWLEIQQTLKDHIRKFLEAGKLIIDVKAEEVPSETEEETETVKKIKTILDDYIRPAVEQDGGAITYHSFRDGIVKVKLQGSCSGCPSSTVTLKAGIENLFTRMMPGEVQAVEAL